MAMRRDEVEKGPTAIGAASAARGTGELNALLGKDSSFEGKLLFEGTVRIDGKFTGEIVSTDTLMIGEGIEVKAPAKVRGTLTTASIVIERGVFFEGNCKMDTSGAPPSTSGGPRRPMPTPESAH